MIDPYGRLTASVERHALTSLAARYGYRSDLTFYTRHGDLFAWLCGIISIAALAATLGDGVGRPQGLNAQKTRLKAFEIRMWNELEFAYSPVRAKARDLREYL